MLFLAHGEKNPVATAARLLYEPEDTAGPRYQDFVARRLEMFARHGID